MTTLLSKIGYIYKIACLDPEIKDCYVGSCQAFRTRKSTHKSACNNINSKDYNYNVYQFIRKNGGWNNFSMVIIEQVSYLVKHELLLRERFHLENLRATLNKYIPSRPRQESLKAYYEENKTQIQESNKEYYEKNKTQIQETTKAYYKENKTEIEAKAKQPVTCECGKTFRKSKISRHKKSNYHKQYIINLTHDTI